MKRLFVPLTLILSWCIVGVACTPTTPRCTNHNDCPPQHSCMLGTCQVPFSCGKGKSCNNQPQTNQPTPNVVCVPGQKRCRGNILSTCKAGGIEWSDMDCGAFHQCQAAQCVRKARPSKCGNGFLDGNEQCDDGNDASGDGCSRYCLKEAIMQREPIKAPDGIHLAVYGSPRCSNRQVRANSKSDTKTRYIKIYPVVCQLGGRAVVSTSTVHRHIAHLNRVFARAKLVFVMWDIRWENNADHCEVFYNTESGSTLNRYAKADGVSIFYARNINGGRFPIGGYATPRGVVMNASSAGQDDILAHELGHTFGLDHPHDCYHGKDNGRNCSTAGDQLCDTPPDPGPSTIANIAICSDGSHKQGACVVRNCQLIQCPGGARPHIRNLMSYYDCGTELTNEQVDALRCVALSDQSRRTSLKRPCRHQSECGGAQCNNGYCGTQSSTPSGCSNHSQCGSGRRCQTGKCTACLKDRTTTFNQSLCCGGKRDGRGRCCTGNNCCGPSNHAHYGADGQCRCNGGYVWVNPAANNDYRCRLSSGGNTGNTGNNGNTGNGGNPPPQCKANGSWAANDSECCGKQRDDRGKCCTGNNCCHSKHNSYTSHTGGCQCKAGYKWVDTQNVRNDKRCHNPNQTQSGTCIKDGDRAPNVASCCSKDRSDQGICCTGGACCGIQTNSWTVSSGACQCRPGFVKANPSNPKDFRCKKQ